MQQQQRLLTSKFLVPPEYSQAVLDASLLGAVDPTAAAANNADDGTGLLSNQAIIATFIVGLIPFAVATVEFWRRIAVGDSFGTGSDSVVFSIGEDDAPLSSRGRRVLGKGAMATAYVLFAIAAGVLGIVLYAVITSGVAPPSDSALADFASPGAPSP